MVEDFIFYITHLSEEQEERARAPLSNMAVALEKEKGDPIARIRQEKLSLTPHAARPKSCHRSSVAVQQWSAFNQYLLLSVSFLSILFHIKNNGLAF